MVTSHIGVLVEELNKSLGDLPFYTLRQLRSIGFFGSMAAARLALKQGHLNFVKVSQRRCVIPRASVIEYLQKNLVQNDYRAPENKNANR